MKPNKVYMGPANDENTRSLQITFIDSLQFDWKIFLVCYLYGNLSAAKQNRMQVFDF